MVLPAEHTAAFAAAGRPVDTLPLVSWDDAHAKLVPEGVMKIDDQVVVGWVAPRTIIQRGVAFKLKIVTSGAVHADERGILLFSQNWRGRELGAEWDSPDSQGMAGWNTWQARYGSDPDVMYRIKRAATEAGLNPPFLGSTKAMTPECVTKLLEGSYSYTTNEGQEERIQIDE